jgi:predicted TIM-barrel fold metal-dependent hydrolase
MDLRIIDAHTHTWSRQMIGEKDLEARRVAAKRADIEPQLDSPVKNLRAAMQDSGIEKAVVLPIDSGLNQRMPLTLQEKTNWHADEVSGDPNIVTFVGLDPRRGEEGLMELQRAVQEKGCRGWKLYPPNGFYPDEDRFYPYYELCTELNIPIVIHTGFTSRFKHVKYAKPVYVDKVAADFPSLKLVLAHVGTPWENEALMVAAKNPNVSVDLSGWQVYASKVPMKLFQLIADAKLARVFPNRVIWGSDYPLFEYIMKLKDWAEFFINFRLPDSLVEIGYSQVTAEELEQCLWKNAERVFFGGNP